MALDQAILVCAFEKNLCIGAYAGAIQFGEIEKKDQLFFKKEESATVSLKKLSEFLLILEALGRNLAAEGKNNENISFQLSGNEKVVLEKSQIEIYRKRIVFSSKPDFILEFDEFIYIHFLSALSNVLLFITMPTKEEFFAMKKYATLEKDSDEEKLDIITQQIRNPSPHRIFMLEQFLQMNKPVIEIFKKILYILGEK